MLPKVYFGLHMVPGAAEYDDNRLFVNEESMKKMNSSFSGKPLVVKHKDVNLDKIQEEADGYVVKSFYNKADGKCWAEFLVVSDAGHKAITDGWKLSNAYTVKKSGKGGRWNNIEYHAEVLEAEYDHLAIVDNPRYAESIILTPEQFKEYNIKKETELMQLQNSIKEKKPMLFEFLTKKKVENSDEIAKMSVTLKNGELKTIEELVNIVNSYDEKIKAEMEEKKKNEAEEEEKKKKEDEEKKKNEAEAKKKEDEEKAKQNALNADQSKLDEIKNAIHNNDSAEVTTVETQTTKVNRGKKLFGSAK